MTEHHTTQPTRVFKMGTTRIGASFTAVPTNRHTETARNYPGEPLGTGNRYNRRSLGGPRSRKSGKVAGGVIRLDVQVERVRAVVNTGARDPP